MRSGIRLFSVIWLLALALPAIAAAFPVRGNVPGHSHPGRGAAVKRPIRGVIGRKHLSVIVAPALRQAIARYFSGFELPVKEFSTEILAEQAGNGPRPEHGLHFACTGDFDGNGQMDAAVYLIEAHGVHRVRHSRIPRRRWLLVAFHQTPEGDFTRHVIFRRWDPEFWRNEYVNGKFNRVNDDEIDRKPHGSDVTYVLTYKPARFGELRLRHDGISEYYNGGEAEDLYHFKNGHYHNANIFEE